MHELGHSFGFRHSGTDGNDYADETGVMGYAVNKYGVPRKAFVSSGALLPPLSGRCLAHSRRQTHMLSLFNRMVINTGSRAGLQTGRFK